MFGFQTAPKSEQNRLDFRRCLKSERFDNRTSLICPKSELVQISAFHCMYTFDRSLLTCLQKGHDKKMIFAPKTVDSQRLYLHVGLPINLGVGNLFNDYHGDKNFDLKKLCIV